MGATRAAAVGIAHDAAAVDVDDGVTAANAAKGTAQYVAGTTANEHNGSTIAVWHWENTGVKQ